jgi:divalent metal cation (Fe/Co/Zn/Cd) transporter
MKLFNQVKHLMKHDRDLKLSMVRREMLVGTFQSGIKAFSYSVSSSQAMKADFIRSVINLLSPVFRISASQQSSKKADDRFNYGTFYSGYSLSHHLALMTPGNIFMVSAFYNMISPVIGMLIISPPVLNLNIYSLSVTFT